MINYSIVMRSVNANLLEINQAKSRINQAKKDGQGAGQEGHRPGEDREAECVRHLAVHRCDDHREVCQAHHFSRQRVFKS